MSRKRAEEEDDGRRRKGGGKLSSLWEMRERSVCRTVITLPTVIYTSSLQNRQDDRLADRRTTH